MSRYKDDPIYGGSLSTGESVVLQGRVFDHKSHPALVACFLCLATYLELGNFELWS